VNIRNMQVLEHDLKRMFEESWIPRDFRDPPRCSEVCPLLGCYASLDVTELLMLRDGLSVPSSRVKQSTKNV